MATAKTAKVPLEVNQPLTGKVKFVSYYPEKPSTRQEGRVDAAQWGLTGTWTWVDGQEIKRRAEGRVYINEYHLANSPLQLGLAVPDGKWPDTTDDDTGEVKLGGAKYKWVYPEAVRVSMRRETGGKRLQVTITRLTELPTATGAVPTPPAASTGRATAAVTRSNSGVAPVAVPPQDEQWDALARQYAKSMGIVDAALQQDSDITWEAYVAATATVFIEANKRGLFVPAPHVPLTQEQREQYKQAAAAQFKDNPLERGDADEDDLPFN